VAKRNPSLVGLELEPSGVHAAAVTTAGGLSVKLAASAPLPAGVVRDGEVVDAEALSGVLRTLFAEHKGLDKRVRIGVANQKIVVRVIELPVIEDPKELDAAVKFTAADELPMPLDAAVLDWQPLEVAETPTGPRQRVLLVAARRDMIDKVLAATRGAGLRPEGIDLAAFGMIRAFAAGAAADEDVLYLAVGGLTNLAVARGATCTFTRVVGGGLEAVAVELAERRALPLDQARSIIAQAGVDEDLDVDADEGTVRDARLLLSDGIRRIAGEVRNTIDFHLASAPGRVTRCVLTGPAVAVPGFAEALSADLNLPVEPGVVPGAGLEQPGRVAVAAGLAVTETPA
jgi:type IV pilus assembly protein PilM